MANYVVGDVQGCFYTFEALLKKINFNFSSDNMVLLGDVINRGPRSLEVLRFIYEHQEQISIVLGNHDIFALAVYFGAIKSNKNHTLSTLFKAKDALKLMSWLLQQPLIIKRDNRVFVHAGILPSLTVEVALTHAQKVEEKLRGPKANKFLASFFDKKIKNIKLCEPKKIAKFALGYLTLMRMCPNKNSFDLSYAGTINQAPKELSPWFKLREPEAYQIYFGHWAALGFFRYKNYFCLDSGAVWGHQLSAWNWDESILFQVDNQDLPALKFD